MFYLKEFSPNILIDKKFQDMELSFEFKMAVGGNDAECVNAANVFIKQAFESSDFVHIFNKSMNDFVSNKLPQNKENDFNFGKNLFSLRRKHLLTQKQVAMRSGLTAAAVSQIEKGNRIPSLRTAFNLAKVFDCSVEAMIKGVL